MAWGLEFGGTFGKLSLSILRVLACFGGILYIRYMIKKGEHKGFIFCVSLILAGAMGNILDSIFYGLIFDKGTVFDPNIQDYMPYEGIANFTSSGYTSTLHGCVVDMFYFPIIQTTIPESWPFWAGESFEFFRPVFNVADAAISIGFVIILFGQKTFFKEEKNETEEVEDVVENNTISEAKA